jgi:hypothetical protein
MYSYNDFPLNSKAWVYQSNRLFTDTEVSKINELAEVFVDQWESHGNSLKGLIEVRNNAFIVILADEQGDTMCGRAQDGSVRLIKEIEEVLGTPLMNRMNTAWKVNGELVLGHMNEFKEKILSGDLSSETIVFNNTITTKETLGDSWEVPAKYSWHKQLF